MPSSVWGLDNQSVGAFPGSSEKDSTAFGVTRRLCQIAAPGHLAGMPSAPAASAKAFAKTQAAALEAMTAIEKGLVRFGGSLRKRSDDALARRPGPKRWSALECLEHLNRYAAHYLPLLERRAVSAPARSREAYAPGLLGKPFARAMHVSGRGKPMSSPAKMNPLGAVLERGVVDAFVGYQERYAEVIRALEGRELRGSRIGVSAFPIARLHLGDMLYTLVWHNERHVAQAAEALQGR